MTGSELRQLMLDKWGFSYDMQLRQVKGKLYVQVMWKYFEQASFGATEAAYLAHLNWVLSHLESWGALPQVVEFLAKTKEKPRIGKAVSIPVVLSDDRASEWILDF